MGNVADAGLQFFGDGNDIALVDETGKANGEVGLLLRHIVEFGLVEVVHEVLAHHAKGVLQEILLPLAPPLGHRFGPLADALDVALIGQAHQHNKHVEEESLVGIDNGLAHGLDEIASALASDALGIVGLQPLLLHECAGHVVRGEGRDVHALRTAQDGGQKAFGLLAHQEKNGLAGRFLKDFEEFVGRLHVHLFGQPDEHHLIASLRGGEREFAQDIIALGHRNLRLLFLHAHHLQPVLTVEVEGAAQLFAPLLEIVVARYLAASPRGLDNGEHEVQVGVHPSLCHLAGGTLATGVAIGGMLAEKRLRQFECNGQFATALGPAKQLGMGHTPLHHLAGQAFTYFFLCYYGKHLFN